MISWKLSVLSIALGSAATAGFVWLARRPPNRFGAPPRVAPEETARADALRDLDLFGDDGNEVDDVEAGEEGNPDVGELEDDKPFEEEHYDAVDPEDMGTEWLRRATDAPPGRSDELDRPMELAADFAEEVPVGLTDAEGNTELHPAHRRNVAPVDLAPNEEELAQRHASESDHPGSRRG